MLVIVAHHYVVNSGLKELIVNSKAVNLYNIFLLIFGGGGKTGINCFVLITGYFMCKSRITLRKFLKLLLEIEFYKITIWLIFLLTGYSDFNIKEFAKLLMPVSSVGNSFNSAYITFFLFIPFINILINAMNRKQHLYLMVLCVAVYTILPSIFIGVTFNYVTWFTVIYLIGSYMRLYPFEYKISRKMQLFIAVMTILLSWLSIGIMTVIGHKLRDNIEYAYFFVSDSNKILALITAVAGFVFFKNLNIGCGRFINMVAPSTFGVLLIHASSDTMRRWLWTDMFNNVGFYGNRIIFIHAVVSVFVIYIVCTMIDILRIKFIEKPFFEFYDKNIDRINNYALKGIKRK